MLRPLDIPFRGLPPLTAEERERIRGALERMRRRATLLTARGARLFPEAGEEIAAMRSERDAELPRWIDDFSGPDATWPPGVLPCSQRRPTSPDPPSRE